MTSQTHATQKVKIVKKNRDMNEISNGANTLLNIVFIIAVLVTVIPIWVIIVASFTSEKALTTYGYGFWPQEWSIEAYKFLFSKGSIIGTAYKNTIIATVVGTVLCVASVGLYAYPISRADFRWRRAFTFISFFTQLFTAGTVAFYVTCRQILHIGNSIWALFLPLSFSAYWVLVMRSFYKSNVPDAVIESARIDGAGIFKILWKVDLPMITPALATLVIFNFNGVWSEFYWALIVIKDEALKTLPLGLINFQSQFTSDYGVLTAGLVILTVPVVAVYLFFSRYFIAGISAGAVKG